MQNYTYNKAARLLLGFIACTLFVFSKADGQQNNFPVSITPSTGIQKSQKMIQLNTTDDMVVAWLDDRDGLDQIYMQLLNSEGAPQVAGGIKIDTGTDNIETFEIVPDGSGNFFLAWVAQEETDFYRAHLNLISPQGTSLWNNDQVVGTQLTSRIDIRLTNNNANNVVIALMQIYENNTYKLSVRKYDDNGRRSWSRQISQGKTQAFIEDFISTGENTVVAWTEELESEAYFHAVDESGVTFTESAFTARVPGIANSKMEKVRMKPAGTADLSLPPPFYAVWLDRKDDGTAKLTTQILLFSGEFTLGITGKTVTAYSENQSDFAIADNESSALDVAFVDEIENRKIVKYQRINIVGKRRSGSDGSIIATSEGDQLNPRIFSTNNDQEHVIVWEDNSNDPGDIYGQMVKVGGALKWIAPEKGVLISAEANEQQRADLLVNGAVALVTWEDMRGTNSAIYGQTIDKSTGALSNLNPRITSIAPVLVDLEEEYRYTVIADDPDNDLPLEYYVVNAPDWLTFSDVAGENNVLIGRPLQMPDPNPVTIVIGVRDARGGEITQGFNLLVQMPPDTPKFTSTPPDSVFEDKNFSYQATYTGATKYNPLVISAVQLPSWLSLDAATGTISGKPLNRDVGQADVILQVTNSIGNYDQQAFTLTVVNINDRPAIISRPVTVAAVNELYSYQVVAKDSDLGSSFTVAYTTGPSWLSLDPNTLLLEGRVPLTVAGMSFPVVLTVTDDQNAKNTQSFTIVVDQVMDAPQITSTPPVAVNEDSPYFYRLSYNSLSLFDPHVISAAQLPAWLSLDAGTGTISGTPGNGDVGQTDITLKVTNSIGKFDQQTFTLTVINTNDLPIFASTPNTVATVNALYSYQVAVTDIDPGGSVEVAYTAGPSWLSWDPVNLLLQGIVPLTASGSSLTVVLTATDDQNAQAIQSFDIVVNATLDTPQITSTPPTTVNEDSLYTYQLLYNNSPLYDPQVVSAEQIPAWLSLDTATGTISGTPRNSDVGQTDIILKVTNSIGKFSTQSYTLTVLNTNDAPIFTSTPGTVTTVNATYTYQAAVTDIDVGSSVSVAYTTGPTWLNWNPANLLLQGTVPLTESGSSFNIVLTATDDQNAQTTQSFAIVVEATMDTPQIVSTPLETVNEDSPYLYQLIYNSSPLYDPHVISAVQLPAWLSLDAGTGIISGTPRNGDVGQPVISLRTTNSIGNYDTQTFVLTVNNTNDPPFFTSIPDTVMYVDKTYIYKASVTDIDPGSEVTVAYTEGPSWLKWDQFNLQLQGIAPREAASTQVSVTLTANDDQNVSVTQKFTIQILESLDTPRITSNPPQNTLEDNLFSYKILYTGPVNYNPHTYSAEVLPDWLTLDAIDGSISGTPQNSQIGDWNISLRVTNSIGNFDQQDFVLTVINTNDPPFFASTPDTVTNVNSTYVYKADVQDIDPNSIVSVNLTAGPAWLNWDPVNFILQGVVPPSAANSVVQVILTATDEQNIQVEQIFNISIGEIIEADKKPPTRAVSYYSKPAGWTNSSQKWIYWQRPADQSQITKAFVAIGRQPVSNQDYDIERSLNSAFVIDSLLVSTELEGLVPTYIWLQDAAGNVDYKNAALINLMLDRSPPAATSLLSPVDWTTADGPTEFSWLKATDETGAIASYEILISSTGHTAILPNTALDDTIRYEVPLAKEDRIHSWSIVAVDSAGNRSSPATSAFVIDITQPAIVHQSPNTLIVNSPAQIDAVISDNFSSGLMKAELFYKSPLMTTPQLVPMVAVPENDSTYVAELPAAAISIAGFQYFIRAVDKAGNWRFLPGIDQWISLPVSASNVVAPGQTLANQYQMISVPFQTDETTPLSFFEKNFGKYDDTAWRLLRYTDNAYLELSIDDMGSLSPGTAYWLITRESRKWQTSDVNSIPVGDTYPISLNPGWNMISTPYPFDTAWNSDALPAGVSSSLWDFNGSGYSTEQTQMKSWRGYFLYNASSRVETIQIAPVPAPLNLAKTSSIWPGARWVARLEASNNQLSDKSNFIGVSEGISQIDDLIEPPSIGNTPRLYFDKKFQSATDFRSDGDELVWDFVVENLQQGHLVLQHSNEFEFPDSLIAVIAEKGTGIKHTVDKEQIASFIVSKDEKKKEFTLSFIAVDENTDGASVPSTIQLHQPRPNPFRRVSGKQLIIHFQLNAETNSEITIYNIMGQEVWKVNRALTPKGEQAVWWNGRNSYGQLVPAGIYFVSLRTGNGVRLSKKFILMNE